MRFFFIFILLCIYQTGRSQVSVGVDYFEISHAFKNGDKVVYYSDEGDTTINFAFVLRKSKPDPTPDLMVRVQMVLENGGNITAVSDEFHIDNSKFNRFDQETEIIEKIFTLKSNNKDGILKLRYSYIMDSPGAFPSWTYFSKSYPTVKYIPPAQEPEITGPSTVCAEATYTIINSSDVVLENADGVATLTSIGNNQWKITQIGESSRWQAVLKATYNGKTTTKPVRIGTRMPSITGTVPLLPNQVRNIHFDTENSSDVVTVDMTLPSGVNAELTKIDNNNYTLYLHESVLPPNSVIEPIEISARATSACGISEIKRALIQPVFPTGGGGGLDPGVGE